MWLRPVHLCSKTGLDLPQQSLLQWQPHKSTLRNQQFTSWSAYLFCWGIAFGEINGLWFRDIITTSSGVFLGADRENGSFLSIIGRRIPWLRDCCSSSYGSFCFPAVPTGLEVLILNVLYENLFAVNRKKMLSRRLFLHESASVWLMWCRSAACMCCQPRRCHPTLLNKWTQLIVCLWFEILMALNIWGSQFKSPFGTNMRRGRSSFT